MLDECESIFDKFYRYVLVDKKIIDKLVSEQEKELFNKIELFTENAKKYIKENYEFDKLVENAKNNDITVRIITRTGTEPERSRGAYDICVQHNLENEIKFSGILNAKVLRCTLIDDEEIIISCSKGINKGFSKEYKHFYNEKVNEILKEYIDEEYIRDKALTYEKFIFNRLDEMGVTSKETSIKRASEILDIPESSLIKILNKNNVQIQ